MDVLEGLRSSGHRAEHVWCYKEKISRIHMKVYGVFAPTAVLV